MLARLGAMAAVSGFPGLPSMRLAAEMRLAVGVGIADGAETILPESAFFGCTPLFREAIEGFFVSIWLFELHMPETCAALARRAVAAAPRTSVAVVAEIGLVSATLDFLRVITGDLSAVLGGAGARSIGSLALARPPVPGFATVYSDETSAWH